MRGRCGIIVLDVRFDAMSSLKSRYRKRVRKTLLRRDGDICKYCWVEFDQTVMELSITIDHVIPECFGGSHDVSNLVLACMACNGAKGSMDLEEFLSCEFLIRRREKIWGQVAA